MIKSIKIFLILIFISTNSFGQEKFDSSGYLLGYEYSSDEIFININDVRSLFFGWVGSGFDDDFDFLISLSQLHQYVTLQKQYFTSSDFNYKKFMKTVECALSNNEIIYGQILPVNKSLECSETPYYERLMSVREPYNSNDRLHEKPWIEFQRLLTRGGGLDYKKPLEHLEVLFLYSGLFSVMTTGHTHENNTYYIPHPFIYFREQEVKIDYEYLPERVIARAHSPLEGDVRIVIDMDKWMELNTFERIWLMIHEYCHEALGLEHSEGDLEIMFPLIPKNELIEENYSFIIAKGRASERKKEFEYSEGSKKLYEIIKELLQYLIDNQEDLVKCTFSKCEGIMTPTFSKYKLYNVEEDIFDLYSFHVKKKNTNTVFEGWDKSSMSKTKISKATLFNRISEEAKSKLSVLKDDVYVGKKYYYSSNNLMKQGVN